MNNKILGQVLLWVGFVSGALATVWQSPQKGVGYVKDFSKEILDLRAKPERTEEESKKLDNLRFEVQDLSKIESKEDGWHLVNWPWYTTSLVMAMAGIVLIRKGKVQASQKSDKSVASLAEVKRILGQLVFKVTQLAKDSRTIPPSKILGRIDDELTDDFRIFAEGRESISTEFGLTVYADVMTHFAAGERAVNRAWCASADGYVNEAETCLDRGEKMLIKACEILEQAEHTIG